MKMSSGVSQPMEVKPALQLDTIYSIGVICSISFAGTSQIIQDQLVTQQLQLSALVLRNFRSQRTASKRKKTPFLCCSQGCKVSSAHNLLERSQKSCLDQYQLTVANAETSRQALEKMYSLLKSFKTRDRLELVSTLLTMQFIPPQ